MSYEYVAKPRDRSRFTRLAEAIGPIVESVATFKRRSARYGLLLESDPDKRIADTYDARVIVRDADVLIDIYDASSEACGRDLVSIFERLDRIVPIALYEVGDDEETSLYSLNRTSRVR